MFSGSIFEGAPHPPSVLLKLIYHWCCQTNVQNVVQWVKVDNFYVKNFFTHMRSVCVAAVHEKHEKLGGPQKRVEVLFFEVLYTNSNFSFNFTLCFLFRNFCVAPTF